MRSILTVASLGICLFAASAAQAVLLTDFDGNGVTGANIFHEPSFSGSTEANVDNDSTTVSTDKAFSGTSSLKVDFDWTSNDAALWDRLTANGVDPVIAAPGLLTMKVFNASADPIGIALGVREVNYPSDIELGKPGSSYNGTSRGIEFVGANGTGTIVPSPTHFVAPGSWMDLTFNLGSDPVQAFTGNGILEPNRDRVNLENLAIRSPGTGGHVTLYIDDIQTIPGNGGAVPEPGTLALLATGLLPLLGLRRRK